MVQPAVRISTAQAALDVAQALETPSEVEHFESLAPGSAVVRAFLQTPQWAGIRTRIVGDGQAPAGRPGSLDDLSRLMRWAADGAFSVELPMPETRGAYLHAAAEIEAFGRNARQVAPVSPAPARQPVAAAASRADVRLTFGEALQACQAGRHISRESWPAGAYVAAQAGYPDGIGINANTARATGMAEGTVVVFAPYLMQCSGAVRPTFAPWTPDQEDLFARDWRVVTRPAVSDEPVR